MSNPPENEASDDATELLDPQIRDRIVSNFREMQMEVASLRRRMYELENDLREHNVVATTLAPMDGDRTCYRLMGGVLTKRNVGEVLPSIKQNQEQIAEICKKLAQQIKDKDKALKEYQEKYQIRMVQPGQQ